MYIFNDLLDRFIRHQGTRQEVVQLLSKARVWHLLGFSLSFWYSGHFNHGSGSTLWNVRLWPFQTWTFAEGFLIEYVNYGANLKPSWEIFLIWQKEKGAGLPQGSPDLPLGSKACQNNLSGPCFHWSL